MKVKCVIDRPIPIIHKKHLVDWANGSELEITIGRSYTVLAVSKYDDEFYFYVIGDETNNYPLAFPAELFEIVDYKISKYWDCSSENLISLEQIGLSNNTICSFPQWQLQKDHFYEKVLEEDKEAMLIFNLYRDKILSE